MAAMFPLLLTMFLIKIRPLSVPQLVTIPLSQFSWTPPIIRRSWTQLQLKLRILQSTPIFILIIMLKPLWKGKTYRVQEVTKRDMKTLRTLPWITKMWHITWMMITQQQPCLTMKKTVTLLYIMCLLSFSRHMR